MPTVRQIKGALRRETPFDNRSAYRDIKKYISELPLIIERRGWMDDLVSLQGVYEVTIELLDYMIQRGYASRMIIARAALDNLLVNLREDVEDIPGLLMRMGRTEEDLFLDEETSELNAAAQVLYGKGQLTYRAALTTCPYIFFQYESAG